MAFPIIRIRCLPCELCGGGGRHLPAVSRTGRWKDVAHYTQIVWRSYYQTPADTADKADYESLARVISGLDGVVRDWARVPPAAGTRLDEEVPS